MCKKTLPYTISGTVVKGENIGKQLGIPSAKLNTVPPKYSIQRGVYVGSCVIEKTIYDCLIYFGPRLIFDEEIDVLEIHIYKFNKDIYNRSVRVQLTHFIRKPEPFESFDALKQQIHKDKKKGNSILKKARNA